jgi:hypothetical protein
MAEDKANAAPPSPAMEAAQLRKTQAEARKLSAEALSAELDALVPTLPSEVPAGTLTAPDEGSPLGAAAAYRALDDVAVVVERAVPDHARALWLVPDDRASKHRAAHEVLTAQLDRFETALTTAEQLLQDPSAQQDSAPTPPSTRPTDQPRTPPVSPSGLPLVGIALAASALPALMSFFQTDTTVRNRDVVVTFSAVAAAVAKKLKGSGRKVTIAGTSASHSEELVTRLRAAEQKRDELERNLIAYRATHIDEPNPELAAATARVSALTAIIEGAAAKADLDKLDPVADRLETATKAVAEKRVALARDTATAETVEHVLEATTAFLTQAQTPDASGLTPLAAASLYAENEDAYVLQLEPSFAGGESVYEELTGRKDRGLHLGAVAVTYLLLDSTGELVASGLARGERAARTTLGESKIEWEA